MRQLGLYICAASIALSVTSCGNIAPNGKRGPEITVNKTVNYFDKITVNIPCDVYFTQGDTTSVMIVGQQETVNKVDIDNRDGGLNIGGKHSLGILDFFGNGKLAIHITSPDLVGVVLNGSGDFTARGNIDSDTLEIGVYGSGDMNFDNVICDKMTTTLRGTGNITVGRLECASSSIDLAGTGDITVNHRYVEATDVNLRGTGDVDVNFDNCGSATCNIYGVGDITVTGSLKFFEHHVRGTGDIHYDGVNIRK